MRRLGRIAPRRRHGLYRAPAVEYGAGTWLARRRGAHTRSRQSSDPPESESGAYDRASSAGLRRQTSTAVAASTRVTFSISLTSTHASSSSALPRLVAGPYSRHGIPAFHR